MAGSKFDELALQYVLAIDQPAEAAAAAEAATLIQSSSNNRILVGQWVSSINRWISPDAGSGDRMDEGSGLDQDLISRAKALDFLASTLEVLNRDALRADQVKLLAAFFGSLFSSDHRAGVAASAKALKQLTQMKAFQPALASDIIGNVSKLGDDFKLQAPATRLELFELFNGFFADPSVVKDLSTRHGEGSEFMTGLLALCRSERDPKNLLIWFSILQIFLRSFSPSKEMLEATFKAFSAYFPISLRASTTPSGITADDLKRAVRACFSADYRLAGLTIPFLIGKLDQGDAVTVAVKVDILQTLEACLSQYEEPQQSVVPYMDQVWNSLKYEVRNGEVADTVEATLKTIAALTRRLYDGNLRAFFTSAWRDLGDDLANPSYAAQAGRLLVAISGASIRSFDLAASQSMSLIQSTIKNSKTSSHQQDLVIVLNSLLLVRTHLDYGDRDRIELSSDALFGDTLFTDIYQRLWEEFVNDDTTGAEKNGLLQKLMEGMATLVGQRASNDQTKRLCSDQTCVLILGQLAKPAIVCPLTDTALLESASTPATQDALQDSAASSLTRAIPQFPEGFQQVLLIFLSTVESVLDSQTVTADLSVNIQVAAATLSDIVCSDTASESTTSATSRALTYALLQGLSKVLSIPAQSAPEKQQLVSAFIASIHLNVTKSLQTLVKRSGSETQTPPITKEWFSQYQNAVADSIASPNLRNADAVPTAESVAGPVSTFTQLLAFYLLVVRELYISFTCTGQVSTEDASPGSVGLSTAVLEFTTNDQEVCLHHLGLLASSVVRSLSQEEQVALSLDKGAFVLFHDNSTTGPVAGTFSPQDKFRTVPLTMGVLQGLHPAAIDDQLLVSALENVLHHLLSPNPDFSLTTRAALDNVLTILSNKHQPKGAERSAKRLEIQDSIIKSYEQIVQTEPATKGDPLWQVRAFCSILHYLAGDVTRFQGNPAENKLLQHICEHAPRDERYGDAFAKCFGILVSPKQCLSSENHVIRKRLSEQWIYHQAVQPYYSECLLPPKASEAGEKPSVPRAARARAAAVFAVLQHLKYEHYGADAAQIVRIVVSRLSALGPGQEVDSCLAVLNTILDKEPSALKEHLGPLIRGVTQVYRESIELARSGARRGQNDRSFHSNRKHALTFLCRAATVYETSHVLPHRQSLLRPLSMACGDPVREIRRIALATRQAWEALN